MTLEELDEWAEINQMNVQLTFALSTNTRYKLLMFDAQCRLPSDKLKPKQLFRSSVSYEDDLITVAQALEYCHKCVNADLVAYRSNNADNQEASRGSTQEGSQEGNNSSSQEA